jgi:PAS domain S-box-containing protein
MAKATYLLRKAGELVKERQYQDAVEVYLQATETDPSDARAWFGLGVCLYKVDNLDVAHIALERAQKMGYPRAAEAMDRVETAERRRSAEGKGAKATIAPAEARQRAASRPTAAKGPPPRPVVRPEDQKLNLDRYLRVMLIENIETDRKAIIQAIEGTIKDAEVACVDYGVSTSQTMSSTVHHDAAVLDWDSAPDAAAGLIKILKIKRPTLFVICLTEKWDPESAMEILEAGGDYHLVKEPHFASAAPLILAQWARRDHAVARDQEAKAKDGGAASWPESVNALGEPLILVAADLSILQANQAAMKQFKRGNDEFIGRPYSTVFYGEEEPPEVCPVLRALEHGDVASGQIRPPDVDRPFRLQAWPVFSYAGKVSSAVVLLREDSGAPGGTTVLRTREWLYRNLTEKSGAGIAMVGAGGKLEYVNQGLCTMVDQTEQELIGHPLEALVPIEDQETLRECLEAAIEGREPGGRIKLQRADGTSFPAEVRVASFTTDEGTCLVLTLIGVSELEHAEQELWTESRKFSTILDKAVDKLECGVAVLDSEGRVSWANAVAADLLGGDKASLTGNRYVSLISGVLRSRLENADEFVDSVTHAQSRGEAVAGYALRLKDGPALSYWSTPIESGSPAVRRVEHFYPAAAQAVVSVPEGQGALAGLAAAAPMMVFTADGTGKVTWCNPAAPATAGYRAEELGGKALVELAADESRGKVEELLHRCAEQTRQVQKAEILMARSNGQRYWAELALLCVPQEGAEQPVVHGVLRDVTDHKIAQAVRDIVTGQRPL